MVAANYPQKNGKQGSIIIMFRDSATQKHRFLSNFWPCEVTLPAEEVVLKSGEVVSLPAMDFHSSEQAYMAWKTIDPVVRQKIANMTPGDAKKLTHTDEFVLRPDYSDEGRIEAMRIAIEQKFSKRNPDVRQMLLDTGEASIVEGNIWGDTFFGFDLTMGEGQNNLGQLLMYVRDIVRKEEGLLPISDVVSKKVLKRKSAFKSTFK